MRFQTTKSCRAHTTGGGLTKTTAAGLLPMLLLASLPGCTARHLPDWSRVQGVKPGAKTEVQLYKDKALQGRQKIKGRFLSATEDSVTLELTERIHTDMRTRTLQKSNVRKVLTYRPILKRWPGWAAILVPFGASALLPNTSVFTRAESILANFILFIPISIPFFIGSRTRRIYEVPPKHRDLSRTPGPAAGKTEEPNDSK